MDLTSASLAKFKTGIEQANKMLKQAMKMLKDSLLKTDDRATV